MKPSYYLVPDARETVAFFHSLSLPEELLDDIEKISIGKIWIDEAESSWELEYSSSPQINPQLLDTLSDYIKASFNLKHLAWKQLQEGVSLSQPVPELSQEKDLTLAY